MNHKSQWKEFHRLPQHSILAGVCAGIANTLGISRIGTRFLFLSCALFTGIFPFLLLYVALYFILPTRVYEQDPYAYSSERRDFKKRRREVGRSFQNLNTRLNRLESYLVSSEYEWERKYRGS